MKFRHRTAAFDRIDHSRLSAALGSFPAREEIRRWLTAGVFESGKGFAPTEEGTPQGGVISPVLLNVAAALAVDDADAAAEMRRLRQENAELRRANEILKTASAFFAQAELCATRRDADREVVRDHLRGVVAAA